MPTVAEILGVDRPEPEKRRRRRTPNVRPGWHYVNARELTPGDRVEIPGMAGRSRFAVAAATVDLPGGGIWISFDDGRGVDLFPDERLRIWREPPGGVS